MGLQKKIKNKLFSYARQLTYSSLKLIENETWVDLPESAFVKYAQSIGINNFSYHYEDGKKYPMLISDEIKFIGPPIGEDVSCHPKYIKKYKRYFYNHPTFSALPKEHLGLLHNLVIRCVTELSIFPYLPLRTSGLKEDYIFVDVGAFRGYVSIKASSILSGTGKVFCFEPITANNKLIQIQKELNSYDNLVLFKKAVSVKKEKEIAFYRSHNQINSEIPDHVKNKETTQINVKNISAKSLSQLILNENPKGVIISITTNGTEIEIAKSMIEFFSTYSQIDLKIVIPILYTKKLFNNESYFFIKYGFDIKNDYPSSIITKIKKI